MSSRWPISIATVGAAGLMWATRGPALEDLDGANFLLGLNDFSLAQHQPHFPGYPVYMGAAWLASLVLEPVSALQLPGVLSWMVGLWLFHSALAAHRDQGTAWMGWMLLLLTPVGWLTAGRTGSDAMGTGLALAAASCLALAFKEDDRRWVVAAGALGALTLGARLALVPWIGGLAVVALAHPRRRLAIAGFAGGLAFWLAPFCVVAGPELAQHGTSFVVGHFTSWGGAATVPGADPLPVRALQFAALMGVHGMGFPVAEGPAIRFAAAIVWIAAIGAGMAKLSRPEMRALVAVAVPFAVWLLLAQNPEKPRHILPLMPLLATVGALGLRGLPSRFVALAGFAVGAVTLNLAYVHSEVPSPEAQLALWLKHHHDPARVRLFCGQSERLVVAMEPGFRAEYTPDTAERDRRLALGPPPPTLLWTDELAQADQAPPHYGPPRSLIVFERDPLIDPHRPRIVVWTADSPR